MNSFTALTSIVNRAFRSSSLPVDFDTVNSLVFGYITDFTSHLVKRLVAINMGV